MGNTRNQMENRNKQRRLEKNRKKKSFPVEREPYKEKSFIQKTKEKIIKKKTVEKPIDSQRKKEKESKDFSFGMEVLSSSIKEMVESKRKDLETERGNENYNKKALAILETMAFHFDSIEFLVDEYAELK